MRWVQTSLICRMEKFKYERRTRTKCLFLLVASQINISPMFIAALDSATPDTSPDPLKSSA
jgi:hypothetical protein